MLFPYSLLPIRYSLLPMPLHLIKLCVGCDSVEDLEDWIAETWGEKRGEGLPAGPYHTTRMVPKRVDELVDGGSLYWIVKGGVQCRQRLTGITPVTDAEGNPVEVEGTGFFARCLQHEVGHLDGFLYTDVLLGRYKRQARKTIKAYGWNVPGLTWLPGEDEDPFGH